MSNLARSAMQARLSKLPQLPPELAGDGEGDEEEESRGVDGYGVADAEREMPRTSSRAEEDLEARRLDARKRARWARWLFDRL